MYGKGEYTRRCTDLILSNSGLSRDLYDILIIDDGSEDVYRDDRVFVLRLKENSGYTNAQNQGTIWCGDRYEYILFLNNDTEPEQGFLKDLLEAMEGNPDVAIATSVRLHPQGNSYQVELYGIDLLRGYQAVTTLDKVGVDPIECNWAPLCSSLIRYDVIRELGLLDKRMKNHSSDLDFCLRVKLAGYKHFIIPTSRVIHFHEVTTSTHKISPEKDQAVLLEKLAGLQYAQLMKVMPLDYESKTYGKLEFTVYQK